MPMCQFSVQISALDPVLRSSCAKGISIPSKKCRTLLCPLRARERDRQVLSTRDTGSRTRLTPEVLDLNGPDKVLAESLTRHRRKIQSSVGRLSN